MGTSLLHAAGTVAAAGCNMAARVTNLFSKGDKLGCGGVDVPHLLGHFPWAVTAALLALCLAALPAKHQVVPLYLTLQVTGISRSLPCDVLVLVLCSTMRCHYRGLIRLAPCGFGKSASVITQATITWMTPIALAYEWYQDLRVKSELM